MTSYPEDALSDERGVFILRWSRKVKDKVIHAKDRPFKIYLDYFT